MSFNFFISYFKRIVSDVGWAFMDEYPIHTEQPAGGRSEAALL
ncbi:hypothetical protein [Prevotella fusca]